jgi:D-serine deaminase-like pyridoxal phosphate-dependent protein
MSPIAVNRALAALGIGLRDAAHMTWLAAQVECAHALRAWFEAGAGRRCEANVAYRAALDREEAAARDATSSG